MNELGQTRSLQGPQMESQVGSQRYILGWKVCVTLSPALGRLLWPGSRCAGSVQVSCCQATAWTVEWDG